MKKEVTKNKYPDADEIAELIRSSGYGNDTGINYDKIHFDLSFHGAVYSKLVLSTLRRARITPDIIRCTAFNHLLHRNKPVGAVILIDKKMHIKEIVNLFCGYRHELTEFTREIIDLCRLRKVKRCAIIYNFDYKKGGYLKELYNIDVLFKKLSDEKIKLVDAVKIYGGKTISIISPVNDKGYK